VIKHTEDNQSVLRTPQLYTSRQGLEEAAPQWLPVYDWYRANRFAIAAANMKDIMRSGHRPQGLLQLLNRSIGK
jgi:hypothetical protein